MFPILGSIEPDTQFPLVADQTPAGQFTTVLAWEIALSCRRKGIAHLSGCHYAVCGLPQFGKGVETYVGLPTSGGTVILMELKICDHRRIRNYHLTVYPFHGHAPACGIGKGKVLCSAQREVHIIL